ncbi:hypothetical protein N7520_001496 [Penicillium odoratum]|uniref:uncharacterized protein n=1 Tax=Penicillium odoratum TaxID=1167516 RepID=UPI0025478337|nr:uncharacterized protein N7520_001496 [Penicillium odoratum]KAJ5778250.1 hypothetical protein N7520_001496 [Penicillium odoratum]
MSPKEKKNIGWIWPKDPRPGNSSSWPRHWRFLDVMTNKGPDVYVGVINKKPRFSSSRSNSKSTSPERLTTSNQSNKPIKSTNWDRWKEPTPSNSPNSDDTVWDGSSDSSRAANSRSTSTSSKSKPKAQLPWARREDEERYDYRQRMYKVPDMGTWSAHHVPRRYRDVNGVEYPANYWHDIVHGKHDDDDDCRTNSLAAQNRYNWNRDDECATRSHGNDRRHASWDQDTRNWN